MNTHDKIKIPPIPLTAGLTNQEYEAVMRSWARQAIANALQEQDSEWKRAVDDELTTIQSTADSYPSAKEAVKALIDWNVIVATDPKVNVQQGQGEPVAWPTHEFAIVVDRMYEGEGPSLAMWNGENYQFSDGDCYDRETDGSLDGYTAEWLTHHQLEQRLFAPQPAESTELPSYKDEDDFHQNASTAELGAYQRGWNACREAMIAAAPTPPADAQAQQDETEQLLLDRLSDLLKRTAIALKGPEADHMHDWSDLPEVAARAVEAAQRAVSIRSLKTEEAFNSDIPVTEQEEEEWKRLEYRK